MKPSNRPRIPRQPKTVNPYDLNSLAEHDKHRPASNWVDWNDKPNPYDLNSLAEWDRRKRDEAK